MSGSTVLGWDYLQNNVDTYKAGITAAVPMGKTVNNSIATFVATCHCAPTMEEALAPAEPVGFPLHPPGKPELVSPEELFRVISPMLFLQGERDRQCDLDLLRRTLTRVGAPTTLQVIGEADQHFKVLKRSHRTEEEVQQELLACIYAWIQKIADV